MNGSLQIAEPLCIQPKQPFSWSFFRHNLFKKCKRAYFFHYYGSQDGWDEYADPRSRQIHKLKSIKTIDMWLEDVFTRSIRELFITPHSTSDHIEAAKQLKEIIRKLINAEHREYSAHEWDDDHRTLNLFETYYEQDTEETTVRGRALEKLYRTADKFSRCELFKELCAVKYFQWKTFTPPIYAYVDRKQVWAAPALIWHDRESYNVLNIRLTHPSDEYPLSLGISAIYLAQRAGVPYDRVQCRKLFINDQVEILSGHCEIQVLQQLITDTSAEMLALMSDEGYAIESNFSCTERPEQCNRCNFKEVCRDR